MSREGRFDCNGFFGEWPFRRFYRGGIEGLRDIHQAAGITGGAVSSLNSVFYNDPMEAEELLAEALRGTPYLHVMGVNPTLPALEKTIAEGTERFGIRGVRIYPGYHHYCLNDSCMERLHRVLARYALPLLVSIRLEDERLNYLAAPRKITVDELCELPDRMPDIRILYTALQTYEALELADTFRKKKNLFLETSWFKSPVHPFEEILTQIPSDQVLYGSGYPLNCLQSTLTALEYSAVSQEDRNKILSENAVRFFSGR